MQAMEPRQRPEESREQQCSLRSPDGGEKQGVPQGIILHLLVWLMQIPQQAGFFPQSPSEEHLGPTHSRLGKARELGCLSKHFLELSQEQHLTEGSIREVTGSQGYLGCGDALSIKDH